jgi:hypothetical protein
MTEADLVRFVDAQAEAVVPENLIRADSRHEVESATGFRFQDASWGQFSCFSWRSSSSRRAVFQTTIRKLWLAIAHKCAEVRGDGIVCIENLNPDVMVMQAAQDRV